MLCENIKLKYSEAEKDKEIAAADLRIKGILDAKTGLENLLQEKQGNLKEKENTLINLEFKIKDLNNEINFLASEKTRLNQIIGEKTDVIAAKDSLNQELNNKISSLNFEKEHLSQIITEKNKVIDEKEDLIRDFGSKVSILASEKTRLDQTIGEKNMLISSIYNSQTYKLIVRPIWAVLDFIKFIFRRDEKDKKVPRLKIIYRSILLLSIIVLFTVFIVFPMKIKKIFMR